MATATQRIPVLVTASEKSLIAEKARSAGLSMGEYLRRAAAAFQSSEDEKLLEGMIEQMLKTTEQANRAIDDALAFVAQSNERIEILETQHRSGVD